MIDCVLPYCMFVWPTDAGASETTDQSLSPELIPSAKQTLSVLIHAKTNFGYNLLRWVKE